MNRQQPRPIQPGGVVGNVRPDTRNAAPLPPAPEDAINDLQTRVNALKYYVHDPLLPITRGTFTTSNLKGRVAHNIRTGNVNARLRVGDPIPIAKNPKRVLVVRPCAAKKGTKDDNTTCTNCAEVEKRLRKADPTFKHKLFDPVFDRGDEKECRAAHGASEEGYQKCLMEKACFRRGMAEHGWGASKKDEYIARFGTFDTSMQQWPAARLVRAGEASFCCHRNRVEMVKIAAQEMRIIELMSGTKPSTSPPPMVNANARDPKLKKKAEKQANTALVQRETERTTVVQAVIPIALAARQNAADMAMLTCALGTIQALRVGIQKRIQQLIDLVDGFEYTPGKKDKLVTAIALGGAAAYAAKNGGSIAMGVSTAVGSLYGYARGSVGVVKDIIEGIKFASDKIMQLFEFILKDPKRAQYIIEIFVVIKQALCGAISRRIFEEPPDVQVGMFSAASDGTRKLTANGTWVCKRLFVTSLEQIFTTDGGVTRMTSGLNNMLGMLGPAGASAGFLASVASEATVEIFSVYAKQKIVEVYFENTGAALTALVSGSCIVEPPPKPVVTTQATLNEATEGLRTAKAALSKRLSTSYWFGSSSTGRNAGGPSGNASADANADANATNGVGKTAAAAPA